jgi:hypothetical protein
MNETALSLQLDRWDAEWRALLRGVSLVAEIDVAPEESRAALDKLGTAYWRDGTSAERKERLLTKWPACLVVGMAGVAATDYQKGSYYEYLWEAAGYVGSYPDQRLWGQAFLNALDSLRLPRFPTTRRTFVGPILMHCGIPTYCLKDLLRLLIDHVRYDPGLDADSFVNWAAASQGRMSTLDKPVQDLILDGGEYAYHVIDRLLNLLDRMRDPTLDQFGVGLPERIITEASRLTSAGLLGQLPGSRRPARAAVGQPRLALDPFGEGSRILLPHSERTWRVTVDGQPHDIQTAHSWLDDELDDVSFPLPRPVAHVQVRHVGEADAVSIPVVRSEDPLLVFSEDGELLPAGRALPPEVVWALFPEDRQLAGDDIHEVSEAFLPLGWQGWTLLEVDLGKARFLGLAGGIQRSVRDSVGPRLQLPEPIPGVTAAHRQPVYDTAPVIALPDDQPRRWYIEVRSAQDREATPVRLSAVSGEIDPWRDMPRPVIGTFDIAVLGPLGFSFHRRVAIAEGLSVVYQPSTRLFTDGGLDPATAELSGQAPVSDTTIAFGEDEPERVFGYGPVRYMMTPPHISILHNDGAGRARWSSMPLRLAAGDLASGAAGSLLVRAPAGITLPRLRAVGAGVSQDVRPQRLQHAGHAQYPLTQLTDTVASVGQLDLSLHIGGRLVPVAFIRSDDLAADAVQAEDEITFVDCAPQPGLHIGIYAVLAPWREVTVLPVLSGGRVALPAELIGIGPLRVLPAVRSPSASWPYWPSADESFLVSSALRDRGLLDPMITFVAGEGPCPRDLPDEHAWLLATLADTLMADGASSVLRALLDMRFRMYPARSVLALAGTWLSPAEAVAELIRTRLAELPMDGNVDADVVRELWGGLQVAAALLSGPILARPDGAGEFIELITHDLGPQVGSLLTGERDPYGPDGPGQAIAVPEHEKLVADADAVLAATPYWELSSRIRARPAGVARASAALALAMRAAAATGSHRVFRQAHRRIWLHLALSEPELVSLDILAAQTAIAAIDRRKNRDQ